MYLTKIKEMARLSMREDIKRIVLAVPTYYDDDQRIALKDGASRAGFEIKKIVDEPIAAATAYGLDEDDEVKNILVISLGGR